MDRYHHGMPPPAGIPQGYLPHSPHQGVVPQSPHNLPHSPHQGSYMAGNQVFDFSNSHIMLAQDGNQANCGLAHSGQHQSPLLSQAQQPNLHYKPMGFATPDIQQQQQCDNMMQDYNQDTEMLAINIDEAMIPNNMFDSNISLSPRSFTSSSFGLGDSADLSSSGLKQETGGSGECGTNQSHGSPGSSSGMSSTSGATSSEKGAAKVGRLAGKSGRTSTGSSGSLGKIIASCAICGKSFNNSSALAKHKLTHSDERKHICTICNKAFKRQDHLNGHMMTHRSKKPFECKFEGCDKSYCDSRSLRRHLENHHQHQLNDPNMMAGLPCASSFFQFDQQLMPRPAEVPAKSPGYRNQFSPISPAPGQWTGQYFPLDEPKPVQCEICKRRFKNVPALNGHMRLHGGYVKKENSQNADDGEVGSKDDLSFQDRDPTPQSPTLPQVNYLPQPVGSPLGPLAPSSPSPRKPINKPLQAVVSMHQSFSLPNLGPNRIGQPMNHPGQGGGYEIHNSSDEVILSQMMGGQFQGDNLFADYIHQQQQQYEHDHTMSQLALRRNNVPAPLNSIASLTHNQVHSPAAGGGNSHPATPNLQHASPHPHTPQTPSYGMHMGHMSHQLTPNPPFTPSLIAHTPCTPSTPVQSMHHFQFPPVEETDQYFNQHMQHRQQIQQQMQDMRLHQPQGFTQLQSNIDEDLDILEEIRDAEEKQQQIQQIKEELQQGERHFYQRRMQEMSNFPHIPEEEHMDFSQSKAFIVQRCDVQVEPDFKDIFREDSLKSLENISRKRQADELCVQDEVYSKKMLLENCKGTVQVKIEALRDEFPKPGSPSVLPRHRHKSGDGSNKLKATKGHSTTSASSSPSLKDRIKRRPEPLNIPAANQTAAFATRLRSPRLWDPVNHKGNTPPPYTPPPMLSPMRHGAGLFWNINPSASYPPLTPMSAPVFPKLTPIRRGSMGIQQLIPPANILEEDDKEDEEPPTLTVDEPPPETDIKPHINIGVQYQANIPPLKGNLREALGEISPERKMWDPTAIGDLTDEEIQCYQDFACCAAVPGNGTNKEYALHLLFSCKGDVQEAILKLIHGDHRFRRDDPMFDYRYQETEVWTKEEIEAFQEALHQCHKDFFRVAKEVGSKNVKQCIEFYYLWKKVCTDEYKRLRLLRRRREQEEYNLRSRGGQGQMAAAANSPHSGPSSASNSPAPTKVTQEVKPEKSYRCKYSGCQAVYQSQQALSYHVRQHSSPSHARPNKDTSPKPPRALPKPASHAATEVDDHFPCRLCGKVFTKVKSRNAHMKSHRNTGGNDEKIHQ